MRKKRQPINGFTDFVLTRRTGSNEFRRAFILAFQADSDSSSREFGLWGELRDFLIVSRCSP